MPTLFCCCIKLNADKSIYFNFFIFNKFIWLYTVVVNFIGVALLIAVHKFFYITIYSLVLLIISYYICFKISLIVKMQKIEKK